MKNIDFIWTDELKIKFADFCLEMLPYTPMFMLIQDFIKKQSDEQKS